MNRTIQLFSKYISFLGDPKVTFSIFLVALAIKSESLYLLLYLTTFIAMSLLLVYLSKKYFGYNIGHDLKKEKNNITRNLQLFLAIVLTFSLVIFFTINDDKSEIAFFASFFIINFFMLAVALALKYKLSAHLGINLTITSYFTYSPYIFLFLALFSIIVGISRIVLKKHTIEQLILTIILVFVIVLSTNRILLNEFI